MHRHDIIDSYRRRCSCNFTQHRYIVPVTGIDEHLIEVAFTQSTDRVDIGTAAIILYGVFSI